MYHSDSTPKKLKLHITLPHKQKGRKATEIFQAHVMHGSHLTPERGLRLS